MNHLVNAIVDENPIVRAVFRDFDDVWFMAMKELRARIRQRLSEGTTLDDLEWCCNAIDEHHNDFRL